MPLFGKKPAAPATPPSKLALAEQALSAALEAVARTERAIDELHDRRRQIQCDIDDLNRVDADQHDSLDLLGILLEQLDTTKSMLPVLSSWLVVNHRRVTEAAAAVQDVHREINAKRLGLLEHNGRLRQLQADPNANPAMIADAQRDHERMKADLEQLCGSAA